MQVMTHKDPAQAQVLPHVYCIGDANGKMMLAHAASAQGISAVENILGHSHRVNHLHIPAACFTHPEIAMVGLSEPQAQDLAKKDGFALGKSTGHFRANSKALAENEGDGIAKVLYRKDTGEVLGVHIIGLHAADLIQECANAMMAGTTVQQLAMMVRRLWPPTASLLFLDADSSPVVIDAHASHAERSSRRRLQRSRRHVLALINDARSPSPRRGRLIRLTSHRTCKNECAFLRWRLFFASTPLPRPTAVSLLLK